jgi:hypothetical protein
LPVFIDTSLKRIINAATNNDLTRRYRSCAEFLKALFDYSKKAKDWKMEDDIIFAVDKNQNEFKIYQSKKGYILETKKKGGNWRKDNNHSGNLPDIIDYLS